MSAPVLFEEIPAGGGTRIGVATLNTEKTLNALSLEMVDLLAARLHGWAEDPKVALVVLQGAGEKAFCAGGDLQNLYRSMLEHHASERSGDPLGNQYAADFFGREYRLDYAIHTYPKPVLCWGHGIVMGGGVGLMSGASHRVVTERSRIAMPEISVGLYPDVGGSWLLARVPRNAGLFLALTGAPLDASDALFAGFADYYIAQKDKPRLFDALAQVHWGASRAENDQVLGRLLREFNGGVSLIPGPLQENLEEIAALCRRERLEEVAAEILRIGRPEAPYSEGPFIVQAPPGRDWLQAAARTLTHGSPGTARLAFELQKRARHLSLAEVFRMEYIVSLHCATHADFAEGIRALLIDKDKKPRWKPADLAAASPDWAAWFFEMPWPAARHPLAGLETTGQMAKLAAA